MIAVSHPTGNTFVRALLQVLEERRLLASFHTTLALHEDDLALRLLPPSLRRQAMRRAYAIPRHALSRRPLREIGRLIAPRIPGALGLSRHETGRLSVDAIYRDLDRSVARSLSKASRHQKLTGVYCYEDGALETFRAAQVLRLRRFYELPIAYWETSERLLREEAARWPAWEPTLGATSDSRAKQERKTRELELAQTIIVPSRFVLESLPAWAHEGRECHVVPFGSPAPSAHGASTCHSDERDAAGEKRPLRVLFAGSMTQRKGLADLFAAIKILDRRDVELIVMGAPALPLDFYQRQAEFRYEAPRPHQEVLELMRSCDVLALPSIVEGRALVQQEAMACGLPLIVTANAGGDDLIEEGQTGFLVPICSPEAIAEKISWLADNRAVLPPMREAARAKAAQYTWAGYGNAIADLVQGRGE